MSDSVLTEMKSLDQTSCENSELVFYDGDLGCFHYDPNDFQIESFSENGSLSQVLRYVGNKVKNIVVPDGVISLDYTFKGTNIMEPPILPSSVKSARYAFANCIHLVSGVCLPDGIEDVTGMYQNCIMLVCGSSMPETVRFGSYFYENCVSLSVPYQLSSHLEVADGLYRGCRNLLFIPSIPENIYQDNMLDGCVAFHSRKFNWMY